MTLNSGEKSVFNTLQWGRSTRAPENVKQFFTQQVSRDASMGPEHEGSGK